MYLGMDMHHGYADDTMTLPMDERLAVMKKNGLECVYFKSPVFLSKTLDKGEMRHYRQTAKELGLLMDFGIGRINPYNATETSQLWIPLAAGDYFKAVRMQLEAGAEAGCTDFIACCAGSQHDGRTGYFVVDRFRTDVPWNEQMEATAKFLKRLSPVLKDLGVRVCVETHEELTSHELLRLIEEVGEEYVSVCFDTYNVITRGEDPVRVGERLAPYIRSVHARDCILRMYDKGIEVQVRPCGEGIVDFKKILAECGKYRDDIHVFIEDFKGCGSINIFDPYWRNVHPELKIDEVMTLIQHAIRCEKKIASGNLQDFESYQAIPYAEQRDERLKICMNTLRAAMPA